MRKKTLYLVITTIEGAAHNDPENIVDVLGVYTNSNTATKVKEKAEKREPIKGLDYDELVEFSGVAVITRTLNQTITNEVEA